MPQASAAAFAQARDTPRIALAPRRVLFGVPSISQMACAVCILAVLVVWSVRSVRANGRRAFHWAVWVGWFFALAGTGVSEYLVQRHGDWYLSCYTLMSAAIGLMLLCTIALRRAARK